MPGDALSPVNLAQGITCSAVGVRHEFFETRQPPPPLRAFGDAARLTAGLVHIIDGDDD